MRTGDHLRLAQSLRHCFLTVTACPPPRLGGSRRRRTTGDLEGAPAASRANATDRRISIRRLIAIAATLLAGSAWAEHGDKDLAKNNSDLKY
jgi:hypothetical protein